MTWLRSSKEEGGGTSCLADFTHITLAPEGAQLVSCQVSDWEVWNYKLLQFIFHNILISLNKNYYKTEDKSLKLYFIYIFFLQSYYFQQKK